MNTINMVDLPDDCYICRNERIYCTFLFPELPWVVAENEQILIDSNIPYRRRTLKLYVDSEETMEVCEYWNPDFFEQEELILPLYEELPDLTYQYLGMHSKKVITAETNQASIETKRFVEEKLREHREQLCREKIYIWAKEQLGGGTARIICAPREIRALRKSPTYNIEKNGNNYKIVRIPFNNYDVHPTNWVAIFDMNVVPSNGYVMLKIPEDSGNLEGIVRGKSHSNIIAIANEIGVKEIMVIPS